MSQNTNQSHASEIMGPPASEARMAREAPAVRDVTRARDPQEKGMPEKRTHDANTLAAERVSERMTSDGQRQQDVRSHLAHGESRPTSARATTDQMTERARASEGALQSVEAKPQDQRCMQTRMRAYEIYEERLRSGTQGCCNSDWAQAERELSRSEGKGIELDGDLIAGTDHAETGQTASTEHLRASRS